MMVPMGHSKGAVLELSERLRRSDVPARSDLEMLGEVLIDWDEAREEAARQLNELDLVPTTRLKTSDTIIDKLKRQPELHLLNIRDLAGARIVQRMTLDQQDELAEAIAALWPGCKVIDRRATPSHGYRAVHLAPKVLGRSVEIQLRTLYQDTWAQMMEAFGDSWGRDIRYGGPPENPSAPAWEGSSATRAEAVGTWIEISDALHDLADLENDLVGLRNEESLSTKQRAEVEELEARVERLFGPLRTSIRQMAEGFATRPRASLG